VRVGDHVAVNPSNVCGDCEYCLNGHQNLCRFWDGLGVVATDGAAQQFFTAPLRNVYKLKPETDLFEAALIEPLACAIRGWDILPRRLGDHVLVYGSGTMGLLMAQLAGRAGAATVTIVDLNQDRLQTAAECGIALRYTSADDAAREKWDVVIDCTGNIRAIEDALTRVKPAGYFQDFGVAPADRTAQFSPFRVYRDEVTIVRSMAVHNSFGRAVELFEAGVVNARAMISHSFTLDDYPEALELFRGGQGRKVQVRPNDTESRVFIG
jgi:2-desacetyl-2-hydroxyethyl bacteriochlorophyllide A dehydrogenase